MENDNSFLKGIFKKVLREIMVFDAQKRKEIKPSTDYVVLLAGGLVQSGLHVAFEYELQYSDGSTYRYDLWVREYPHLVIDVDGEDSHSPETDKKKDNYTSVTHRKDVLRVWNKNVEKNMDKVVTFIRGLGELSNQNAEAVNRLIEQEKKMQEDRINQENKVEEDRIEMMRVMSEWFDNDHRSPIEQ